VDERRRHRLVAHAHDHPGRRLDPRVRREPAQFPFVPQVGQQPVAPVPAGPAASAAGVGEPGQDGGLPDQPGEGGQDARVQPHAVDDVGAQVLLHRRGARAGEVAEPALHRAHAGPQRARQQLFLVGEVVVEHPVGDPGLAGDEPHGQPGRPAFADEAFGGRDQVLAQALLSAPQRGGSPRRHHL
jgi:hypothetical protein